MPAREFREMRGDVMYEPKHRRLLLALVVGLTMLLMAGFVNAAGSDRDRRDWVDEISQAVLMAQAQERDHDGATYGPYLGQLQIVSAAVRRGDVGTTYAAMNRFMDMLLNREYGIDPEIAEWLFDYCHAVAPPKFHDLSRHNRRVMDWPGLQPMG